MRKNSFFYITILLIFLAGCAGVNQSLYGGQQISHNGKMIYKGQSVDSVERALGAPDVVSSGQYFCKNASNLPWGVMLARNTIEWVYIGPAYSTLIYIDHGMVSYVHQIPSSKVIR